MRFVKLLALVLATALLTLGAVSCADDTPENTAIYYDVRFNSAGGSSVDAIKVLDGALISEPAEPTKEGYIFNGWKNGTEEWDFSSDKVISSLELTASWINAKSLFNFEVNYGKVTLTEYKGELSSISIPTYIDGLPVVALGDKLFGERALEGVYEIIVGENIVSVGNSAFYGCSDIEIKIEGKLEYVGERAFFECAQLKKIELASGSRLVPFEAFVGCTALETVVLSDTIAEIGENAFEGCTSLKTVTAHASLKKISDSAFLDCGALTAIYYYGSADEWDSVEISEGNNGNDAVIGARLYIYSEQEPDDSAEGEYWYFDKNGKIRIW